MGEINIIVRSAKSEEIHPPIFKHGKQEERLQTFGDSGLRVEIGYQRLDGEFQERETHILFQAVTRPILLSPNGHPVEHGEEIKTYLLPIPQLDVIDTVFGAVKLYHRKAEKLEVRDFVDATTSSSKEAEDYYFVNPNGEEEKYVGPRGSSRMAKATMTLVGKLPKVKSAKGKKK